MFAITVLVGPAAWSLLYKTEEPWKAAIGVLKNGEDRWINLVDDFEQVVTAERAHMHGFMHEDLEHSKMAHIERALHQARMQAEVQKRAEHDPQLRMLGRSPAVFQPGMLMPPAPNGGHWPA